LSTPAANAANSEAGRIGVHVRKAVIPAAGFGTRLLPLTKTVPKEMLPLAGKPVIQYIVEEAVASGIEEIILVTSPNKKALEDYFDSNFELEHQLEATGKGSVAQQLRTIRDMAAFTYVRQKQPLGNGHAVLAARHAVGNEPFAVLWGDDVLVGRPPVLKQLIQVAERNDAPVVGVRQVAENDFEKYGMLEVELIDGRLSRAISVIEKPSRTEAPSDLAQIGGFVLTPDIFDLLASAEVGPSGEIYLADALIKLMQIRTVYAYAFEGTRYDAGNHMDYLKASLELALADPSIGPPFREYLASLGWRGVNGPL
jgi:UTP--glucose-1-phosphate uridylyltransferase